MGFTICVLTFMKVKFSYSLQKFGDAEISFVSYFVIKKTTNNIMSKSDKYYWQSKDCAKWLVKWFVLSDKAMDKAPQELSDTKSLFYFVFYILGFLFYFILGDWVVRLVYKKSGLS